MKTISMEIGEYEYELQASYEKGRIVGLSTGAQYTLEGILSYIKGDASNLKNYHHENWLELKETLDRLLE